MQRECAQCGHSYEAVRPSSKYCGDTCGKRARRSPKQIAVKPRPMVASAGLEAVAARELEAAGRLDTVLGQAALVLARRLESPMETGASIASMTKQLRETLVDALKGAAQAADPLDELRARRDSKRAVG
jgi:hypothetical protein